MITFEPVNINGITFKNRLIRSATYEGRCDAEGFPTDDYYRMYENLAKREVGGIITGFAFISKEGRAMHPAQAGIDSTDKINGLRKLTQVIHRYDCPVIVQIAHTGRQTLKNMTGSSLRGCSGKRSVYFREKPVPYSTAEAYRVIGQFGISAAIAREAGFDGIELHAAHGYLIHQFLLPGINDRKDEFGIDKVSGIGSFFLEKIMDAIRSRCGEEFPVFIKISGGINDERHFGRNHFISLIKVLDRIKADAIEISYGTMDYPFNIFRGDLPLSLVLEKNPLFKARNPVKKVLKKAIIDLFFKPHLLPFTPAYNLSFARLSKTITRIPVISVGGFRNAAMIEETLSSGAAELVALSRPFLAEPDFVTKIKSNCNYNSACINCNKCAVMCDLPNPTVCYRS